MYGHSVQDAREFWTDFGLAEEVDEDVFVRGFIVGKYQEEIEPKIKEIYSTIRNPKLEAIPCRIVLRVKEPNGEDTDMVLTESEIVSLAGRLTERRIGKIERGLRVLWRRISPRKQPHKEQTRLPPGGWWSEGRLSLLRHLSVGQRHLIVTCIFGAMTQ